MRSRIDGNDDAFFAIIDGKSYAEMFELLFCSTAFAGVVIEEFLDKLSEFVPPDSKVERSPGDYLDSVIENLVKGEG